MNPQADDAIPSITCLPTECLEDSGERTTHLNTRNTENEAKPPKYNDEDMEGEQLMTCHKPFKPQLRELDATLLEQGVRNSFRGLNEAESKEEEEDDCVVTSSIPEEEDSCTERNEHFETDEDRLCLKKDDMETEEDIQEEKKSASVAEDELPPSPNVTKSSSHGLLKSKSYERHLSEAAQFFEAIGEPPQQLPTEIIEEESDDDDDDDDTLQTQSIKPSSSCPEKLFHNLLSGLPTVNRKKEPYYKGLSSYPPPIVKSGMDRGNYAQLHRKAWLEVSDKYHRYGKNLRQYYKYWESLSHPTNAFFDWLDSKGDSAGQPLPNLPSCPRSSLDSDTVLYITNPEVSAQYALSIRCNYGETKKGKKRFIDTNLQPVDTSEEGWIFILRDSKIYAAPKVTSITGKAKKRFHHSSFFGGKAVEAAGIIITDSEGHLLKLLPHSGHYRPGEAHIQRMLYFLQISGFDLSTFDVDIQQLMHVAREKDQKKIKSLYFQPATYVACFLTHKALMIGEGIFEMIHEHNFSTKKKLSNSLWSLSHSSSSFQV